MSKFFIFGSFDIKVLPECIKAELHQIMDNHDTVLIGDGDAPGIDTLVQKYFKQYDYPNVRVYHMGRFPRNNIGNWNCYAVMNKSKTGREYYAQKDMAMQNDCDRAIAIWNGAPSEQKQISEIVPKW